MTESFLVLLWLVNIHFIDNIFLVSCLSASFDATKNLDCDTSCLHKFGAILSHIWECQVNTSLLQLCISLWLVDWRMVVSDCFLFTKSSNPASVCPEPGFGAPSMSPLKEKAK